MGEEPVYQFDVRRVAVEEIEELDCFVVGVSEHEDGSGESLMFMVPLNGWDAQDQLLGQDTYYIATAWGATVYGGLTSCVLEQDMLLLRFDAEKANTLGISEEVRLHLHVSNDAILQLSEGLGRVLFNGPAPYAHIRL